MATTSSGLCLFSPIALLLRPKAILQGGPLQRGRIKQLGEKFLEHLTHFWVNYNALKANNSRSAVHTVRSRRLMQSKRRASTASCTAYSRHEPRKRQFDVGVDAREFRPITLAALMGLRSSVETSRLSGQPHQFLDLGESLIHSFGPLASDVHQ